MSSKPFSPAEFKEIYSRVPRFCVDLVIRSPKGIILGLRNQGGWENMWHFPGGMVFYRESIEQTIHRVAKEEANVTIKVIKFLEHMEFHDEVQKRGFGYSVSAAFLCDLVEGEPQPDEDSDSMSFFTELPVNLISQHKALLEKYWGEIKTAW